MHRVENLQYKFLDMHILQQSRPKSHQSTIPGRYVSMPTKARTSLRKRFLNWCDDQQRYRFGWLASIIAIHGCIMAPITVIAVMLGGNSMIYWALAIGAMAISLIVNLAAESTRVTIPVFFLGLFIDVVVIAICLANYFISIT